MPFFRPGFPVLPRQFAGGERLAEEVESLFRDPLFVNDFRLRRVSAIPRPSFSICAYSPLPIRRYSSYFPPFLQEPQHFLAVFGMVVEIPGEVHPEHARRRRRGENEVALQIAAVDDILHVVDEGAVFFLAFFQGFFRQPAFRDVPEIPQAAVKDSLDCHGRRVSFEDPAVLETGFLLCFLFTSIELPDLFPESHGVRKLIEDESDHRIVVIRIDDMPWNMPHVDELPVDVSDFPVLIDQEDPVRDRTESRPQDLVPEFLAVTALP